MEKSIITEMEIIEKELRMDTLSYKQGKYNKLFLLRYKQGKWVALWNLLNAINKPKSLELMEKYIPLRNKIDKLISEELKEYAQ